MITSQKRVPNAPVRKQRRLGAGGPVKQHAVPTTLGDKHMGATEDQVSKTMPPRADDDEPKQG
jgi:hypothetical protein